MTMTDYEVGYGRPPKATRFKKGGCANPRGRGKAPDGARHAALMKILSELVEYRSGRNRKIASRLEVAIRKLFDEAARGEVRAVNNLLNLRAHARKAKASGPIVIELMNDPELQPGEAAEEWLSDGEKE